ncbi:methyltransferase [Caballeronia sp. M1242]|uniref:methyltransferase n=1 Tax=Caballeronia sp. M1242 TaxID=2814653 RepID=UPI0019D27D80|nr:methyltransferase [Caballeronia sp. M1242]QSN61602.1 methyltransferase domain-containing protein [Caballeronia sp. M1242]
MSNSGNADVPSFENRDPNSPGFWDERFDRRFMPWDQAGVPDAFRTFVSALAAPEATRVLIPGCGNAYEAAYLAERGMSVRAIDFSPSAVAAARAQLAAHGGVVEEADFFTYQPPFAPDWIYERAFLCALPKDRWTDYAERMAALARPGALLSGFFFIGATPKGPPFGIERNELDALLAPHFELVDDHEVSGSIPVFAGRERWLTWRRA